MTVNSSHANFEQNTANLQTSFVLAVQKHTNNTYDTYCRYKPPSLVVIYQKHLPTELVLAIFE